MPTLCGHPKMEAGKCPDCMLAAADGRCRYCTKPYDDHIGLFEKNLSCPPRVKK